MTTYARVDGNIVVEVRDIDPLLMDKLAPNKQAIWRPLVIDTKPTPSANQVVDSGGYVIESTRVRQTWALRNKTADELEADDLEAERQQLTNWLTDIQVQLTLDNAARALLSNAQRISELEKDTRVLLRAAKRYVRQQKRGLV